MRSVIDIDVGIPEVCDHNMDNNSANTNVNIYKVVSENTDIHIDSSQTKNRFDCPECDYACSYDFILKEHMECHLGEKTLGSLDSGKQLAKTTDVNKKEKQFKCQFCEMLSNSRSSHEEHLILHEDDILLNCTECSYSCINEDILIIHFASHNMFPCNKCTFIGKSLKDLSDHSKSHSVKSYKCTECDYNGKTKSDLKTHMDNHTGEKDFSVNKSPVHGNTLASSNKGKRGLSISPEVTENTKASRRRNTSKKIKDT